MSAPNWNELAEKIHAWAVEKGWWEGGVANRDIAEIVANFHSEVSEAWEEYRAGRMETWYAHPPDHPFPRKPEGFWVEIADLCIRVLDTAGAYGWDMAMEPDDLIGTPTIPQFILALHGTMSDLTRLSGLPTSTTDFSGDAPDLTAAVLDFCWQLGAQHGADLLRLIKLKHRYNCTREYRHGGKLA